MQTEAPDETHQTGDDTGTWVLLGDALLSSNIMEAAQVYRANPPPIVKRNKHAYNEAQDRLDAYDNERYRYMNMTGEEIRAECEEAGEIEMPRVASDKTEQVRATIRKKFTNEFNAGARAAYLAQPGYPKGFFYTWAEAQRNAWFCGWSVGGSDRIAAILNDEAAE